MSPQTLSAGRAIVNRIAHPGRRFSGCARALCIARLRGALCRGFFVLLASIDTMPQAEGAIRSSCAVQRRPSGHRIDHMGRRAKAPWGARWAQGWSRSAEYPVEHDVRERFLPGHGGDDRDHSIGGRGGAAGADSAGGLPRWLPTWTPQAVRSPPCVPLKPLFCRGYSARRWIPASGWIPKKTALSLANCRASPSSIRISPGRNQELNGLAHWAPVGPFAGPRKPAARPLPARSSPEHIRFLTASSKCVRACDVHSKISSEDDFS